MIPKYLGAKKLHSSRIFWSWDAHFDFLSQKRWLEIGLKDNFDFEFLPINFPNQRNYTERERNVLNKHSLKTINVEREIETDS